MIPGDDEAEDIWRPAVWRADRVRLWDYQLAPWRKPLFAQVAHWNAVRPKHVPRLDYLAAPERLFADLLDSDKQKSGILVCNAPPAEGSNTAAQFQVWMRQDRTIYRAIIVVNWNRPIETAPYCHELMHAMTAIGDDPLRSKEQLSCVLGRRRDLGPFDLEYLESVYRFQRTRQAANQGAMRTAANRFDRLLADRARARLFKDTERESRADGPLFRFAISLIERSPLQRDE